MTHDRKIKILIADDQQIVRHGLQMSLDLEEDLIVIGEAHDGLEAYTLVLSLTPDVVVMDVEMPAMDGIAATRLLKTASPGTAVIIHSLHDGPDVRALAENAGARAFVPKHALLDELIQAIRAAASSAQEDRN